MVKFSGWLDSMNFNLALTQSSSSPSYFLISSTLSCFPSYSFTDSFTQASLRRSTHTGVMMIERQELIWSWMATACCIGLFCDESVRQEHDCQCMLNTLEYFSYTSLCMRWIESYSVNTSLQIINTYISTELKMPSNIPSALRVEQWGGCIWALQLLCNRREFLHTYY